MDCLKLVIYGNIILICTYLFKEWNTFYTSGFLVSLVNMILILVLAGNYYFTYGRLNELLKCSYFVKLYIKKKKLWN